MPRRPTSYSVSVTLCSVRGWSGSSPFCVRQARREQLRRDDVRNGRQHFLQLPRQADHAGRARGHLAVSGSVMATISA